MTAAQSSGVPHAGGHLPELTSTHRARCRHEEVILVPRRGGVHGRVWRAAAQTGVCRRHARVQGRLARVQGGLRGKGRAAEVARCHAGPSHRGRARLRQRGLVTHKALFYCARLCADGVKLNLGAGGTAGPCGPACKCCWMRRWWLVLVLA